MTDAGLMGKASIDWDHLDTTDSVSPPALKPFKCLGQRVP